LPFQSTLPRGERQQCKKCGNHSGSHFNPRSREGSDAIGNPAFTNLPSISIHAPARGATCPELTLGLYTKISIHAPARGATAILTKNPFDFLAKIDKIYYYLLPFSFYNILSFLSRTLFMHFSGANLPAI